MTTDEEDLNIEACAVRCWPALVSEQSGGWLLRATPGDARRRSNSAVPPDGTAFEGLGGVEDFYRRQGFDPLVQVSPAHRHEALDAHLAAAGYEFETPVLVLRAPLSGPAPEESPVHVELGDRDRQWTRARAVLDRHVDAADDPVMDRIPGRTTFARALRDGTVAGVGAGVVDGGRLGVFGMGTAPEHRGGGVARAVLSALLAWGRREGAESAWLQVETSNSAARRLYESHGFTLSHRYHYRRKPA